MACAIRHLRQLLRMLATFLRLTGRSPGLPYVFKGVDWVPVGITGPTTLIPVSIARRTPDPLLHTPSERYVFPRAYRQLGKYSESHPRSLSSIAAFVQHVATKTAALW
ncbi:hypothetical protein IQ06DRAFT_20843 [Phaeosphaeriaceae sp. SRC1lsM3a]|nr:hypothetical protein IQ06DRAFT_20843 [Stagonospora sp. SRC1lsM3a]